MRGPKIAVCWSEDAPSCGNTKQGRILKKKQGFAIIPKKVYDTYLWERFSWPEKRLISSCPILMPTGWPVFVAISPRGNLAVFQWRDQCESGLEFLSLNQDGDTQWLETGLPLPEGINSLCLRTGGNGYPVESDLATLPVFSPDGRFLVFGWQQRWEWWSALEPDEEGEDETSVKIGLCDMGTFELIDWETRMVFHIPVQVDIPAGWYPPGHGGPPEEMMATPIFVDTTHFQWQSPMHQTCIYTIENYTTPPH